MGSSYLESVRGLIDSGLRRRAFLGRFLGGVVLAGSAAVGRARAADAPNPIPSPRLGLCVTDLQRSVDFYCKGLGFSEIAGAQTIGIALGNAMQTDSPLDVRFVQRGGLAIELLHFAAHKPAAPHPMDQPGLTNLTVLVEDFDKALALVPKFGGTVIEKTRTSFGQHGNGANIVFVEDPDGVRIGIEALL
ncbi:MAG: lactoylglutathione lyase-like lyase [Rhodospirillales bacterium]|nr:lactoylglutathione lyase-like lyase [Rhodospirillales bacterium]